MKICTCNNCSTLFEDMNPGESNLEYSDHMPVQQMVQLSLEQNGSKADPYWGCPNCNTDDYLEDNINKNIFIISKMDKIFSVTDMFEFALRIAYAAMNAGFEGNQSIEGLLPEDYITQELATEEGCG